MACSNYTYCFAYENSRTLYYFVFWQGCEADDNQPSRITHQLFNQVSDSNRGIYNLSALGVDLYKSDLIIITELARKKFE